MELIEMKNIYKKFKSKTVLDNITLTIEAGEIFGLLGPSGAGKTTMVKLMTGQLRADGGKAMVLGQDCSKMDDEAYQKIGMQMDNSGLYERLSCYDNLLLFTRIFHLPRARVREVLQQVRLWEDRKTPVSKLSKGMRKRLILARAILKNPSLLFLDEPTSGLDPKTTREIHTLLRGMQKAGTTIFLTTHNMEEASALCNHIALLNEGNIVEYGEPGAICRKYNEQNGITILCTNGSVITLSNRQECAEQIAELFREGSVESIHSTEPNLETVFLTITGRGLEE